MNGQQNFKFTNIFCNANFMLYCVSNKQGNGWQYCQGLTVTARLYQLILKILRSSTVFDEHKLFPEMEGIHNTNPSMAGNELLCTCIELLVACALLPARNSHKIIR